MNVVVHKFGGASVKDAASIENVIKILGNIPNGKNVVVVSATGKTTNALEVVVNDYFSQNGKATESLERIKLLHFQILSELGLSDEAVIHDIMDAFVEIEWIIEDDVQDEYDYLYDQIVSVGEIISSKILYHKAVKEGLEVVWSDVRGAIMTDNTYREAKVDWEVSQENIRREVNGSKASIVITQGFIGSSSENFTTTLGREGSDFSAGIFAYCLDASELNIWKDVSGILTGDPRVFDDVTKIDRLDYKEAIEMTYYGAKVIHPKTIKPLQNKGIPLRVRPFHSPTQEGSLISSIGADVYPPVVVLETNQILLSISTKDFSFVAEEHLSEIFTIMTELNIKVNMMRNTAISFSVVLQDENIRVKKLLGRLSEKYKVTAEENLELITIRHYDGNTKSRMTEGKLIHFEETIHDTIRMAVKDAPSVSRKP